MRVSYTLPGLLPEAGIDSEANIQSPQESFGARLRQLKTPEVPSWRDILHLNAPEAGPMQLSPPPRPEGVNSRDPSQQRLWWRALLQRRRSSSQAKAEMKGRTSASPAVEEMLDLLIHSQKFEDQIFARHFSESEE
jgi:hypothetical protein